MFKLIQKYKEQKQNNIRFQKILQLTEEYINEKRSASI